MDEIIRLLHQGTDIDAFALVIGFSYVPRVSGLTSCDLCVVGSGIHVSSLLHVCSSHKYPPMLRYAHDTRA